MTDSFEGFAYQIATNWLEHIPVTTEPIKYLEIGVFYGGNVFSVAKTYATHPDSEIHCVDPWIDYDEYTEPEYKNKREMIYNTFCKNVDNSSHKNKIHVHRGFSRYKIPELEDNYFDMIYIDANHEPEYVLEDAVLSFRKLKKGGYLIFDDYGWGGPLVTQKGIDAFLSGYHNRMKILGIKNSQLFAEKIR